VSALAVTLHDARVGTLSRIGDDVFGDHWMTWDRAWWRSVGRPVFGQRWEDRGPSPLRKDDGLIAWFEHLLPRGPMRRAIAREVGVDEDDGMALLAWLSDDLVGAVGLHPTSDAPFLRRPVPPLQTAPADSAYRTSLPGAQWKLSLAEDNYGYTLPVRGSDAAWIGKFATGALPRLVEVEAATMAWAAASGVEVPEVRVVARASIVGLPEAMPQGEGTVYLIRRFDRAPEGRVHTEDFGQILDTPPGGRQFDTSYEALAAVIAAICPPEDLRAFVRQLVFCLMAGNYDAHSKNWSVIYPDRRHPRLSPAYDLVATVVYPDEPRQLALRLDGHRGSEGIDAARFARMAQVARVEATTLWAWVCEDAARVRACWADVALRDRFSHAEQRIVEANLTRVGLG